MLFNGAATQGKWEGTRALHYGDGVFRTLLVLDGQVIDLDRQIDKLARDADALELECPHFDLLRTDIERLVGARESGALKIILSRADAGRGYAPSTRQADRLIQLRALPEYSARHWTQGVVLGWSKLLLAIQPRLAGIKHLNRLEQVLASRNWPDDQQEVLMCDAEGRVSCGTRSNVFFVIDDVLVTPDVSLSGVSGAMREKLIALARRSGIGCEIGLISPDEVRHAQECFVSNSLIGIWPVRRIGSLELNAPGPKTHVLMEALQHPWRGV